MLRRYDQQSNMPSDLSTSVFASCGATARSESLSRLPSMTSFVQKSNGSNYALHAPAGFAAAWTRPGPADEPR